MGRLGTVPLGAVGLSNLVYFFTTVVFSFLLVVTTPRVAAAVAQDNPKEVRFPVPAARPPCTCIQALQAFVTEGCGLDWPIIRPVILATVSLKCQAL